MPGIDDHHAQVDQPRRCKEVLHQLSPALPLGLRNLGIAVAGQIHKVDFLINEEIVHMDGLPRRGPNPGKVLPVQHPVDHRGLAHIGLAGKYHAGDGALDKLFGGCSGLDKLRLIHIQGRHVPPTASRRSAHCCRCRRCRAAFRPAPGSAPDPTHDPHAPWAQSAAVRAPAGQSFPNPTRFPPG